MLGLGCSGGVQWKWKQQRGEQGGGDLRKKGGGIKRKSRKNGLIWFNGRAGRRGSVDVLKIKWSVYQSIIK
jgi:hypothetical protein